MVDSFFEKMTWADRGPGLGGPGERGPYLSVIIPVGLYSAAYDYAERHRDLLGRYPLSGTGAAWLHLTVQTVHQLTTPAQSAAAGRALGKAARQVRPFTVELGPARLGATAVTAAVYPEDNLGVLYALAPDVLESVEGIALRPREPRFWPHVSLGYAARGFDGDALNGELRDLRPGRAHLTVDRVHLVEMIQDPAAAVPYHWKLLEEFKFGRAAAPAPASDTARALAGALLLMADRARVNDRYWLAAPALETARQVLGVPPTGRATHRELRHQPDAFKVSGAFSQPGQPSSCTLIANGMIERKYHAKVDGDGALSFTLPNGRSSEDPDLPPDPELYEGIRDAIRRHHDPDWTGDEP